MLGAAPRQPHAPVDECHGVSAPARHGGVLLVVYDEKGRKDPVGALAFILSLFKGKNSALRTRRSELLNITI